MISWTFILMLISKFLILKVECGNFILADSIHNQLGLVKMSEIIPYDCENNQSYNHEYFNSQMQKKRQYCKYPVNYSSNKDDIDGSKLIKLSSLDQRLFVNYQKYIYYQPTRKKMHNFYFQICLDNDEQQRNTNELIKLQIIFSLYVETGKQSDKPQRQIIDAGTQIFKQKQKCQTIYVQNSDYLIKQFSTIKRFILALKLGKSNMKSQKIIEQTLLSFSQTINQKSQIQQNSQTRLIQNNQQLMLISQNVRIKLILCPLEMSDLGYNILFSLICIIGNMIIGILISKINIWRINIRITRRVKQRIKIRNNISHFNMYIPEQKFELLNLKNGLQCSICLFDFENSDIVRKTPCYHTFHKVCLDLWCINNLICPLCRKKLDLQSFSDHALRNQL